MLAAAVQKLSLAELPGRPEAEQRLRQSAPPYAVALTVEQYSLIAGHFGPLAADEALECVVRRLPPARVYRWTGGSLLIFPDTPESIRVLPERLTVTFESGDEMVQVPISLRRRAFETEPNLARRIDHSIAAPL